MRILAALNEGGSGRELVQNGELTLDADGRNTATTARFKSALGETPEAEVTIGSRGRGQFNLLLQMSRATIDVPEGCPRPELATVIELRRRNQSAAADSLPPVLAMSRARRQGPVPEGAVRRDRGQTMPGRFRNGRAVARLAALLICAGAIATAQASAQGPPPAPYQREGATVKLAAHVYAIPDFKVGMVPNVGIVVDTKGAQGATPGSMLVDEFSAK